jgi:hypothetical protein
VTDGTCTRPQFTIGPDFPDAAKLSDTGKINGFKRLDRMVRAVEQRRQPTIGLGSRRAARARDLTEPGGPFDCGGTAITLIRIVPAHEDR